MQIELRKKSHRC